MNTASSSSLLDMLFIYISYTQSASQYFPSQMSGALTQSAMITQMGMQAQTLTDADLLNQRKSYDMYGMRGQTYVTILHSLQSHPLHTTHSVYMHLKPSPHVPSTLHLLYISLFLFILLCSIVDICLYVFLLCFVHSFRELHTDVLYSGSSAFDGATYLSSVPKYATLPTDQNIYAQYPQGQDGMSYSLSHSSTKFSHNILQI